MRLVLTVLPLLAGCSVLSRDDSGDPQSCRERAAYRLAEAYPDPFALDMALTTICEGQLPPTTPPVATPAPPTTAAPLTGPAPTVLIDTLPSGTP